MGLDSGDNRLDPVMPRFVLSASDAADLVAFLKQLGTAPDPGVNDGALMLGTMLRPDGSAIQTVLTAYFDEVNRRGGLFGRQLVLRVTEPRDGEAPSAAVARIADAGTVFALVAPMIAGAEAAVVAAVHTAGLPTIGPLTPRVRAAPISPYVFYLNGGVEGEARALAGFAASTFGSLEIVCDGSPLWQSVASIAVAALGDTPQPPKLMRPGSAELTQALAARSAVLWLADGALIRAAVAGLSGGRPTLLLPSALAGDLLANGAPTPTFIAFASGPADITPEAAIEFRALAQREDLSSQNRSAQRQALAAAKILVQALQRAGRDVTRQKLIDALETLQNYQTGLMPAVTFSPSRRIGADGAWIVPLDGGAATWWNR
jgi:ABC-type branched-subunit amino acid transport system substrate-binding protein